MDKKWHYTEKDEYPEVSGEYLNQNYPQIPCLVVGKGFIGVRYWNPTDECWDDEEADDYFCSKESIKRWMYLDPLTDEE